MITRVEKALGFSKPRIDPSHVKSPVELEAFKRKVWRVAIETALCVVYLGLEAHIGEDELKDIFFSADLTLAEVEHGIANFDEIKKDISKLADVLGHSSINTTRIYIATSKKEHMDMIESLSLVS